MFSTSITEQSIPRHSKMHGKLHGKPTYSSIMTPYPLSDIFKPKYEYMLSNVLPFYEHIGKITETCFKPTIDKKQ